MNILKKHIPSLLLAIPLFLSTASFAHASIESFMYEFVASTFGMVMWVGGWILDAAVENFVIGFGYKFLNSGVGLQVDTLWVVIRDLFNLTFIFALVYIGFKMILNTDSSGTRRWLVSLIMAALLINFSLYITKFVVDVSNILATEIATQAFADVGGKMQISATFMDVMSLQTVFEETSNPDKIGTPSWGYLIGAMIIFLVAGFVFAAGGILLLIRYASLCLYMVFSPLMFLGWVLPGMQSITDKYWTGFLGKAFFAPVYLLLIYFSAKVLDGLFVEMQTESGAVSFANVFQGSGGAVEASFANTIPPFILACIFLIASIVIANKMGADGASKAVSMGKDLAGSAKRGVQNAGLFIPRRVAREVVGQSANLARHFDNRLIASNSTTARVLRGGLATVGLTARTRENLIEQGRNARMGTRYSTADNEANTRHQRSRRNQQQNTQERDEAFERTTEVLENTASTAAEVNTAMELLAKTVRNMTKDELSNMSHVQLTNRDVALNLSDTQIDGLQNSGNFSNDEIRAIRDARNAAQINVAQTGTASVVDETAAVRQSTNTEMRSASNAPGSTPAQISALNTRENIQGRIVSRSAQEVGNMRAEVFMQPDMYRNITPEMVENRLRNGVSGPELTSIRDAISVHLGIAPGTPPPPNSTWDRWYQRSSNAVRLFS